MYTAFRKWTGFVFLHSKSKVCGPWGSARLCFHSCPRRQLTLQDHGYVAGAWCAYLFPTFTCTHCALLPTHGRMARLSGSCPYIPRLFTCPSMVT